jgi:predicted lipoprotein
VYAIIKTTRSVVFFLLSSCSLGGISLYSAQAGEVESQYSEINLSVSKNLIIPAYQYFELQSKSLESAANEYCDLQSNAKFETLKGSFHQTMDAWQAAQIYNFGPATLFNWNYRIQFWPDAKGSGPRQLKQLMEESDPVKLTEEVFARLSVGVQGLPALETLLFTPSQERLADGFPCALAVAISANLSRGATDIRQRWEDGFLNDMQGEGNFFASAQDASVELLKVLSDRIEATDLQKLRSVIGEGPDRVRLSRAESSNSARSIRNIKINMSALHALYSGTQPNLSGLFNKEHADAIEVAFLESNKLLRELPDSFEEALAVPEGYRIVTEAATAIDRVYDALKVALADSTVYLGFNALDGD